MTKRPDSAYEIEALSKGLAVLEALEGTSFEPVKQSRIEQRTGFSRDLVMRTLRTLRLRGYAAQNDRGEWMVGPRFIKLAHTVHARFDDRIESRLQAASSETDARGHYADAQPPSPDTRYDFQLADLSESEPGAIATGLRSTEQISPLNSRAA